jgi:hypothetical protein
LEGDWGGSAIGWAVGEDQQPAPDLLEIRWFSYTEDKFYQGRFLLPQQRIYALLKQGFWDEDQGKQATYNDLSLSVVPTGVVVVWLSSGRSQQVLLGRYQAREVLYDYERYQPGVDRTADVKYRQAHMSPAVQHEIATGTISSKKWDEYLKTYPWKVEFSRPLTLYDFYISYLNAEATGNPPTPDLAAHVRAFLAPEPKPVPKAVNLYVAGAYGRKRLVQVDSFDEQETMAAFQTLHAKHPTVPITLRVEVDERLTKAALVLQAGGQAIPLTKSPVEFFDAR